MSCSGSPFPVGGHDRLAESFHLLVSGHVRREVYAHNLVHVDTASRIPWKERAAGGRSMGTRPESSKNVRTAELG